MLAELNRNRFSWVSGDPGIKKVGALRGQGKILREQHTVNVYPA